MIVAHRILIFLAAAAIAAALLIAAGCGGSKSGAISREQHGQIQKGMTLDEVEAIAGPPERTHKTGSSSNPNIVWYYSKTDGDGLVRISFLDGKVDVITPYEQSFEPEE